MFRRRRSFTRGLRRYLFVLPRGLYYESVGRRTEREKNPDNFEREFFRIQIDRGQNASRRRKQLRFLHGFRRRQAQRHQRRCEVVPPSPLPPPSC